MKAVNIIYLPLLMFCTLLGGCSGDTQDKPEDHGTLESVLPANGTSAFLSRSSSGDDPTMNPLSERGVVLGHHMYVAIGTASPEVYQFDSEKGFWGPVSIPARYPDLGNHDIVISLKPFSTGSQDGSLKGLLDADELHVHLPAHSPVKHLRDIELRHINSLFDISMVGLDPQGFEDADIKITTTDGDIIPYNVPGTNRFQAILLPGIYTSADVSVHYDGVTYWCSVEAPDVTFEVGTRYKFNLIVQTGKLVVEAVSVSDWKEGDNLPASGKRQESRFNITGYPAGAELHVTYSDGTVSSFIPDNEGNGILPLTNIGQAGSSITTISRTGDDPVRIGLPAVGETITYSVNEQGKVIPRKDNDGIALITITEELYMIGDNLSENFRLQRDMDLGGIEWTPVGTANSPFTGTFDGNGYRFSNLLITSGSSVGLFGYNKGKLSNITVASGNVNGTEYVSAICAVNDGGTIEGCHNYATVGGSEYTAGICARNTGTGSSLRGQVLSCRNYADVSGAGHIAGICALNDSNGAVSDCINSAVITATGKNCAGIVAYNEAGNTVMRCSNTGAVNGGSSGENTAGVVGMNMGTVTESFNTADIRGNNFIGGVCGTNGTNPTPSGATTVSCYNTGSVIGAGNVGGVVGYTGHAEIKALWNTGYVYGTGNTGGICGYCQHTGGKVSASWNAGHVEGTSVQLRPIAGRYNGGGEGENNFYDQSATQLTDDQPSSTPFSAAAWPTASVSGWGTGLWGNLGGWNSGGNTIVYPRLSWE